LDEIDSLGIMCALAHAFAESLRLNKTPDSFELRRDLIMANSLLSD